jgi:hypothetical protein
MPESCLVEARIHAPFGLAPGLLRCGKRFAKQRQRGGPLPCQRMAIERLQHGVQAAQIARQAIQQVAHHLVAQAQPAAGGLGPEVRGFLRVAETVQLIDEAPGEARPQVLAQRKQRRGRIAGGEDRAAAALARRVDRDKERLLGRRLERFDVVGHHEAGAGAFRSRQEMAAPAAGLAPQKEYRLGQRSARKRTHARERFGVVARDKAL